VLVSSDTLLFLFPFAFCFPQESKTQNNPKKLTILYHALGGSGFRGAGGAVRELGERDELETFRFC